MFKTYQGQCIRLAWCAIWLVLASGVMATAMAHESPVDPFSSGEAAQDVILQAEELEFFQGEQRLVAMGKVIVESGDTRPASGRP